MYDGVQLLCRHAVFEEVHQSVARDEAASVVDNGKPDVQVSVVAQHGVYRLLTETVVLEKGIVRLEEDVRAVFVLCGFGDIALQDSLLESGASNLSVAVAAYLKTATQCIDGFYTHTVQSDALLEGFAVVLTTCVQHTDGFDHLSLGNTATIVAYTDTQVLVDVNLDAFAGIHLELVDAVVDDLLQQYIYSVVTMASVAQFTDVHTRTGAHMIHIAQVADIVFVVLHRGSIRIQVKVKFFHCNLSDPPCPSTREGSR